ncbi:MAG: hypothetical protein ABR906_01460 [Terracidiphilus sp.]|jgi:urocanate hydratase
METNTSTPADFALQVERFYASLIQGADAEISLGGKLFYSGELDAAARALLVAANIAGAASLTATADAAAQKQAIRDGVVDFLVTSLDEALRILKNEIRKHETVAVCVALTPEALQREMRERGVKPDLARPIEEAILAEDQRLLAWSVASAPVQWLPKLDLLAVGCLDPDELAAHRWLRLAPRYLGRLAQRARLLRCGESSSANFIARVREQVECGEIGVSIEINLYGPGVLEKHHISPPLR